jgi:hypothetical protein
LLRRSESWLKVAVVVAKVVVVMAVVVAVEKEEVVGPGRVAAYPTHPVKQATLRAVAGEMRLRQSNGKRFGHGV